EAPAAGVGAASGAAPASLEGPRAARDSVPRAERHLLPRLPLDDPHLEAATAQALGDFVGTVPRLELAAAAPRLAVAAAVQDFVLAVVAVLEAPAPLFAGGCRGGRRGGGRPAGRRPRPDGELLQPCLT